MCMERAGSGLGVEEPCEDCVYLILNVTENNALPRMNGHIFQIWVHISYHHDPRLTQC